MNKKQRLVAKKHRKNKARIKTLKQAAISAGNKVKKKHFIKGGYHYETCSKENTNQKSSYKEEKH